MQQNNYNLKYYSSVRSKNVDWLWYPYIPFGKITIVQGDPGEGKTMLMLQLTALLTRGGKMPDGSRRKIRNVIYQAAEDGVSDTIKLRLEKAGADCTKVAFLDLEEGMLSLDDARFEKAIVESKAGLLVIDPMQAFVNSDTEGSKSGSLRAILTRMSNVAERTGCAIVLVGHLNKKVSTSKGIYRGLGSIEYAATARSILLVESDPVNPHRKIISHIKSSLAPEGSGYVFELDPESGFRWIGEPEEPLVPESKVSKKDRAAQIIGESLKGTELLSTEIFSILQGKGISVRTAKEAKKELNITTYRAGGSWYWNLEGDK